MTNSALAGAVYPVTVDPEIGANDFSISYTGPPTNINYEANEPAVAYNSLNNIYLVVWFGEDWTDNEYEIFGQLIDAAAGALFGGQIRISDMGPDGSPSSTDYDAKSPSVAYNSTDNEFLVVWYGDDNIAPLVDNELEVFGQRLDAVDGTEVGTNDFRISDMGPDGNADYDAVTPSVAYNAANNEFLVVWEGDDNTAPLVDNEREIFGQRFSTPIPGAGTFTLNVTPDGSGGGTITSSPAGINCPGICTFNFAENTTVTLSVLPNAGSAFDGWSGDVDCPC